MYTVFRRRVRRYIRRVADWRLRMVYRVLYGIMVAVVFAVDQVSNLVLNATASMFRTTLSGSVAAVLAKVFAVSVLLGVLAASVGELELANALFLLSALPVMCLGLWVMASSAFRP